VTPGGVTFSSAGEHVFGYWSVTCSVSWNGLRLSGRACDALEHAGGVVVPACSSASQARPDSRRPFHDTEQVTDQ